MEGKKGNGNIKTDSQQLNDLLSIFRNYGVISCDYIQSVLRMIPTATPSISKL